MLNLLMKLHRRQKRRAKESANDGGIQAKYASCKN